MGITINEKELDDPLDQEKVSSAFRLLVRWAIRRVQNDGETDKRPLGKVVTGESTKGYGHSKRKN